MLPFIFVLLWQLTASTLFKAPEYNFIIQAREITNPIARLSMSKATIQEAQNARNAGQVALSSVNPDCIAQLLAFYANPSSFVSTQRNVGVVRNQKMLKDYGQSDIVAQFQACEEVIDFLLKSAPRAISAEDYEERSDVKLEKVGKWSHALQLYVKTNNPSSGRDGYARMQFGIAEMKQFYAQSELVRDQHDFIAFLEEEAPQRWAAQNAERQRLTDDELATEQQEFADEIQAQIAQEEAVIAQKESEQQSAQLAELHARGGIEAAERERMQRILELERAQRPELQPIKPAAKKPKSLFGRSRRQ